MLDGSPKDLDGLAKGLDKIAKAEGEGQMSDVAQAQSLMRDAFPKKKHGTVQAACWAAYRKLKLSSERRARAIWSGEARRIDYHELEALKEAARRQYIADRDRALARLQSLEGVIVAAHSHDYGGHPS